jgi:hypothetical protein
LIIVLTANALPAAGKVDRSPKRIAEVLEVLKKQFGISDRVQIQIQIVKRNPLGVSVEPANRSKSRFFLSLDAALLNRLAEEELTAALAHELGHIWIYTHHPFLHTEALANEIAMRAVTRDSLKKLYVKLWAFQGKTGNVEEVLGEETQSVLRTAGKTPR